MSDWISAKELRETIGEDAMLSFIKAYGGQNIYIPQKVDSSISKVIGAEAAKILMETCGGSRIDVPKRSAFNKEEIIDLSLQDISKAEIARRLGLSTRYVRQVINRKATRSRVNRQDRDRPSKVESEGESLSEEVRFAAKASGLPPRDFVRQAYDFFRRDRCTVEVELATWKKRQRIVNERVNECERRAREDRFSQIGIFQSSLNDD